MCFNGGLGMNVARMWGGIIMIAGPEPFPDIWPLGVIARFFCCMLIVTVDEDDEDDED